jgi:hypothetical protein
MNIIADPRSTKTADFAYQFIPFPTAFEHESLDEKPVSRLSREQLEAFLAESDNARSGHFFVPSAEAPVPTPEKGLAAGVLKQAAHDLRRFRGATKGLRRELYLDASSWITANDFSWPYSFVNVCQLLDVSPDVIRAEVLADASLGWLDYWTQRAGRVSRKVQASVVRIFANCGNAQRVQASQLA